MRELCEHQASWMPQLLVQARTLQRAQIDESGLRQGQGSKVFVLRRLSMFVVGELSSSRECTWASSLVSCQLALLGVPTTTPLLLKCPGGWDQRYLRDLPPCPFLARHPLLLGLGMVPLGPSLRQRAMLFLAERFRRLGRCLVVGPKAESARKLAQSRRAVVGPDVRATHNPGAKGVMCMSAVRVRSASCPLEGC